MSTKSVIKIEGKHSEPPFFWWQVIQKIKIGIKRSLLGEKTDKDVIYEQRLRLFMLKELAQKEISFVRKVLGVPENGFKNHLYLEAWYEECEKDWREFHVSDDIFRNTFVTTLNMLDIHPRWDLAVAAYVLLNDTSRHCLFPNAVEVGPIEDAYREHQSDYIEVLIHPEASLRDIENKWDLIKNRRAWMNTKYGLEELRVYRKVNTTKLAEEMISEQEKVSNRKNSSSNPDVLNRNIRALELSREGKSHEDTAKTLKEENLVEMCTYADVGGYLRDIREKIENVELI